VGGWGPLVSLDAGGLNGLKTADLEGCPSESHDGLTLFFASNRDGQIDIWVSSRTHVDDAWGSPQKLPAPVSVDGSNDFCPSYVPAGGGMLFISSDRGGEPGQDRIYVSTAEADGSWGPAMEVVELDAEGASTARPQVSVDGLVIVFDSTREGGEGNLDLYVATPR
jgi:OmpA-OmpF porin, OOP family